MKYHSENILENQVKTGEILSDISRTSKKKDWRKYKEQSLAVSEAYFLLEGLMRYGEKMFSCGSYLYFKSCPNGHGKKLFKANFCRGRWCSMCQWRKSLVIYRQVLELIHAHLAKYKSDVPLLLTLTVPNSLAAELKLMLDRIQKSWNKLTKRTKFKRSIRSWFRSLEVTYNSEVDTYHPHFHVLLLVPEAYFNYSRGLYISYDEWLALWQEVTGIPGITQVDIRKVRKKSLRKPLEAITAEVAKYATKPSSYIKEMPDGCLKAFEKVVEAFHHALRGKRLVAFGGLFKQLRKNLKQVDVEKADLVKITSEETPCCCSICQSGLIDELYQWNNWLREYIG